MLLIGFSKRLTWSGTELEHINYRSIRDRLVSLSTPVNHGCTLLCCNPRQLTTNTGSKSITITSATITSVIKAACQVGSIHMPRMFTHSHLFLPTPIPSCPKPCVIKLIHPYYTEMTNNPAFASVITPQSLTASQRRLATPITTPIGAPIGAFNWPHQLHRR